MNEFGQNNPRMNLIDFWSLKSFLKSLKSLEIILILLKSNDFEISYAIFASVGPLGVATTDLNTSSTLIAFMGCIVLSITFVGKVLF